MVKKKKKARDKSAVPTVANKPKQNPPAAADPQGGALGQAQVTAQAADQAPPVGPEGVDVANVGNPAAQPSVGQGDATGGPSQPIPTNQAPHFFQLASLPLQVQTSRRWHNLVITKLLPSVFVVSSVAAGELGTDAMVVGNFTCPTQGVIGEVATPILGPRVLRLVPPVGMEA